MAPTTAEAVRAGRIDDVQELSKNKSQIPNRFIRNNIEESSLDVQSSIPVVDLSRLAAGCGEEAVKLSMSCREWGFFHVINHGVDSDLLRRIEKVATEFFMLPLEEKRKYPMIPGTIQGYGQAFVFSEDQKLDWCNMFALGLEPKCVRNNQLWPAKPYDFSETLEEYSEEIGKLCNRLLRYIAISLKLKSDVFEKMFGLPVQAIRMNYYPPCPRPDLVLGLSPHSDGSALTVLQQGIGNPVGLQILKQGKWIPIKPIPNALVINLGDTIEVLTNGKYISVEHRAVTNLESDRLSLVTFYAPCYGIEIGPMKEFVDDENPCKYRNYNHGEYCKHYVTSKLQGKKTLEFAKIH
ncbi:hypothetical protein M569_03236, partial [Genlisea aurea]